MPRPFTSSPSRVFAAILACVMLTVICLTILLWSRAGTQPRIRANRALNGAFIAALCRAPDERETVSWNSHPVEMPQFIEDLASSAEGRDVSEIRKLYSDVLRRDLSSDDCAAVRRGMGHTGDRDLVARQFAAAPEARRVAQVRQVFVETLGRDPRGWDDASLRRWVDSAFTLPEIRRRLLVQKPLVGVYYFTWYSSDGGRWGNNLTAVPTDSPRPTIGPYDSGDRSVIDAHIRQMTDVGLDFVIVQVTAQSPRTWANAHAFFDGLGGRRLKAAIMLDGLYKETAIEKARWVEKARAEFVGDAGYFVWHGQPLIVLFSARVDFAVPGVLLRNVYWTDRYDPGQNRFNVDRSLTAHDWPFWSSSPQPLINGLVPVVPGYVDRDLGRTTSMEFPRHNGQLYHEQWRRALALHPELITIYSWNEYFEQTAIEPTDNWGDQYLRWTACYVAHAHRDTTGRCEAGDGIPK